MSVYIHVQKFQNYTQFSFSSPFLQLKWTFSSMSLLNSELLWDIGPWPGKTRSKLYLIFDTEVVVNMNVKSECEFLSCFVIPLISTYSV